MFPLRPSREGLGWQQTCGGTLVSRVPTRRASEPRRRCTSELLERTPNLLCFVCKVRLQHGSAAAASAVDTLAEEGVLDLGVLERQEVVSSEDEEAGIQGENDDDQTQLEDVGIDVGVSEDYPCHDRPPTGEQRQALQKVQRTEVCLVRQKSEVEIQCQHEDAGCEDSLQVASELVGEHRDHGDQRLSEVDDAVPVHELCLESADQDADRPLDPLGAERLLSLGDDQDDPQRNRIGDDEDEERDGQCVDEDGVAVDVALDRRVDHPIRGCAFDPVERHGVEDVDAVEDVGSRLRQGEVGDVQDGDGSQDASLDEVPPRLAQAERAVDPVRADDGGDEEWNEHCERSLRDGSRPLVVVRKQALKG